jgi:hypothetical protein
MAYNLQQEMDVLRKEAESLLREYSEIPNNQFKTIDRLNLIEGAITEIETKLFNTKRCLTSLKKLVQDDIQVNEMRLVKLSGIVRKHVAPSAEIHEIPASKMLLFLEQIIECKASGDSLDLPTLVDCVSCAERPDCTSVQDQRTLVFHVNGSVDSGPFSLTDLLDIADSLSLENGKAQCIELTFDVNGIHFNEKTVVPTRRVSRLGLGTAMCMMGVCNKIEQLFSPTSIVSHAAKVCHAICCQLLGDYIILEAEAGDKRWIDLIYPQWKRDVTIRDAIADGIKVWREAFDESGISKSAELISFQNSESQNAERCPGYIRVVLLFLLRDITRSQLPIEIKVYDRSIVVQSPQELDPFTLQAAACFVRDITQTSSRDSDGRHSIILQL